jgi:hypothetical protein
VRAIVAFYLPTPHDSVEEMCEVMRDGIDDETRLCTFRNGGRSRD